MTELNGYPEYDPMKERTRFLWSLFIGQATALIAWADTDHRPTAEEIASDKCVRRRCRPLPQNGCAGSLGSAKMSRGLNGRASISLSPSPCGP
jgi:hypothetical protein